MPDGRMLNKSIAHSEQLADVSIPSECMFYRILPHLDSAGRINGSPRALRSIVCPMRDDVSVADIEAAIRELAGVGLVLWYEAAGVKVLAFPKFAAHQRGARFDREAPSRLPAPDTPGMRLLAGARDAMPRNSGAAPELARDDSGVKPDEVRTGSAKVKGSQEKESEAKPRQVDAPFGASEAERIADGLPQHAVCATLAGPAGLNLDSPRGEGSGAVPDPSSPAQPRAKRGCAAQAERRTAKPSSTLSRATWLSPYLDAWREAMGGELAPGKAATSLTKVRAAVGDEQALPAWRAFLATEGKYASPARFLERYGQYLGATATATAVDEWSTGVFAGPRGEPVDVNGNPLSLDI